MRASEIDFNTIRYFSRNEWPEGTLESMDASIIYTISEIRASLPRSHAFTPSPVARAHVRDSGTSRHSTNNGTRLSDATDFFVKWEHAWDTWNAILAHPKVGGAGIYTDMMLKGKEGDYCMFHIDNRPERLVWVSWRRNRHDKNKYVYLTKDPLGYHKIIAERGKLY